MITFNIVVGVIILLPSIVINGVLGLLFFCLLLVKEVLTR